MEKIPQNFRLPRVTIEQLEEMARKRGLSKTAIVILAVGELHLKNRIDNQERAPARLEENT